MRPAALGDAFAEADEQKRRGDADRAAEHRRGARSRVRSFRPPCQDFPFRKPIRPYSASLASTNDEDDSLQHLDRGVGQAEPALQQPAAGADAAEQDRNRNDGERILPRQEGDEDAGEAVAGGEVGVGAALHRGDLDHAGEAGRRAGQKADGQDQPADAEADDLGGADVAAGDPRGEAEHGVIDQDVGTRWRRRCRTPVPNARRCRGSIRACWRRRSRGSTAC